MDDTSVTLHSDALGLAELYTRRLGDALYFSSRIDPLVRLDESRLHQDDSAWAGSLLLGAPVGAATPFEEIRRLDASQGWRAENARIQQVSFEPSWHSVELVPDPDPRAVLEVLGDAVPKQRLVGRTSVTFSGGWDSRLLAVLAARASRRRVQAWTSDSDSGNDLDVSLSKPVAQALGLRQHVVVPGPRAWARHARLVRRRVQHQTWLHVWLMPLARALRSCDEPLLDGLAGDVLLKSLMVDERVVDSDSPRGTLWEVLAQGRLGTPRVLTEEFSQEAAQASRTEFMKATEATADHPAGAALAVLRTRTARAIAASPLLIFGPEADVRLPFLHPDVIAASLAIPVKRKIGGGFYRELLRAAHPRVAALPSTNDNLPRPPAKPRRAAHPAALMSMSRLIEADECVQRIVGPDIRDALGSREALADVVQRGRALDVLQWAASMAEWRQTYRDRLAD